MQAKFQTQRLSDFTYIYSVQKSFRSFDYVLYINIK